jgi:AbrB family looped-hinge helix DNA binding protein
MEKTRLSSKGQIIIPKGVRESHGWTEGTEFTVEEIKGGLLLKAAPLFPPTTVDEMAGCLKYAGARKTLKQMDDAIAKDIKRQWKRPLKK